MEKVFQCQSGKPTFPDLYNTRNVSENDLIDLTSLALKTAINHVQAIETNKIRQKLRNSTFSVTISSFQQGFLAFRVWRNPFHEDYYSKSFAPHILAK